MGMIRASSEWEDKETAIKEKLRSYRSLVWEQQKCTELFERLYPKVTTQMSTDRVMQDNGNGVEEKMIRKLDLEKQMSESLRHMRTEMSSIIALINQLTGKEYIVIFNRYVMCEAITETCKSLDISESTYWRINRHAILKLSK